MAVMNDTSVRISLELFDSFSLFSNLSSNAFPLVLMLTNTASKPILPLQVELHCHALFSFCSTVPLAVKVLLCKFISLLYISMLHLLLSNSTFHSPFILPIISYAEPSLLKFLSAAPCLAEVTVCPYKCFDLQFRSV